MIRLVLIISLFLLSLVGFAQGQSNTQNIEVTVVGAQNDKGKVYFSLYNSEESFNNRTPFASKEANLQEGVSTVTFTNIASGVYAIVCFHDANDNKKMDFAANGMPVEDYGASNNVLNFGPPRFNDAKFEVTSANKTLQIKF